MSGIAPPARCLLCNASTQVVNAGFRQQYEQNQSTSEFLEWWECPACCGWFVYPVPTPEIIKRHWEIADYNQPSKAMRLVRSKLGLQHKVLEKLSKRTNPGPLLDFGCNFGDFLLMARKSGWAPYGYEPCTSAAERARTKGLDVRDAWLFERAGFDEDTFAAVTAIDVFYYVWNPIDTLRTFHRLLRPGGVLAMRLTNKRFVLGVVRALSKPGSSRDARISKILKAQFHSIGIRQFRRILAAVGFDKIEIQPHALTASWNDLSRQTQAAYTGAAILYYFSCRTINLSPGILLFARKGLK